MNVRSGLDIVESAWPRELRGARVGLLAHPSSVTSGLIHATDVFIRSRIFEVTALFGPQHGIRGETQDNMIEWEGFCDPATGLRVYSLYGETRKPTPAMLEGVDALVIDLQDVGARYYTYIWTMDLCMAACHELGKAVVVLDRPNPIGGVCTEGPVLRSEFASFVGLRRMPVRHGMTIGEISRYFAGEFYLGLHAHVVPVDGWKRSMWFDQTGLPWVMPSPNIPTLESAQVYPGMCLLEGTNLSEGRGTTRPFEIFGAPFIEPRTLVKRLVECGLPGVIFRPLHFQPTFQKHAGQLCGGVQIHVVGRDAYLPFRTAVAVLSAVREIYPDEFSWRMPPYEYETVRLPFDILAGDDSLRSAIERGDDLETMASEWKRECDAFDEGVRRKYLMYD